MKRAVCALSCGFALGAILSFVGCAQGQAGDDDGVVSAPDSGADGTVSNGEGGVNPGDDAPVTTGDDATLGDDGSVTTGDDDGATTGDDGSTTGDDGATNEDAGEDSGGTIVDAGHDAGHDAGFDAGVDAGHDAGVDAGHDAGIDSGIDAGHDAGVDSGVDAGFDAGTDAGTITIATGGVCGGPNNCASGDLCAGGTQDDGGPGTFVCLQLCNADGGVPKCTGGAVASGSTSEPKNLPYCLISITNSTPPESVCTMPCNPVNLAGASGCPAGLSCLYEGTTTIPELTDCEPPGPLAEGAACTGATVDTSCGDGMTCVGSGSNFTCTYVCRVGHNFDCPGSELCHTFAGITGEMFGYCQ